MPEQWQVAGNAAEAYERELVPAVDYVAFAPFQLEFGPGASAATFPIELCGDSAPEGHEEIDVRVGAPSGVSLVDNDLDLILRNDDS